ncbi:MAG: HD domain-containing protein [Campylobacterales bacterium]
MNPHELTLEIEELIGEGADDFRVSQSFKTAIRAYLTSLSDQFDQDTGKGFLVRHTRQIDLFLTLLYKYLLRDSFGTYRPSVNQIPIALVALGSYGREQLCVYSDIDLMILYREPKGYNIRPIIERFVNMLWDFGLKIGHRTHTPEELLEASSSDVTIKTALLESRFIYGSKFLWMEAENELARIRHDDALRFCRLKMEEYERRHRRYPLTMEPWIKEGVGGLRDANTLFWIASVLFGIKSNKELVGRIYSEEEYRQYRQALEFLFRLRSAMHLVAGKKQDRLLAQYQRDVALKLGFVDTPRFKAERLLMSKVFETMSSLRDFCAAFLESFSRRPYLIEGTIPVATLRQARVGKGLYRCEGKLYVAAHQRFRRPTELLAWLEKLPDEPFSFAPSAFRLHLGFSETLRPSKLSRAFIAGLLRRRFGAGIWDYLYRTGFLAAMLPAFRRIMYLAQFDGYHERSVDDHTIRALYELEHPPSERLSELTTGLDDKERTLLNFALLMHDIGKGGKIDHSLSGARTARALARELGFDEEFAERASLLVRYHTLMSSVALREDIYNEKTILSFVAQLKERRNLTLLYLLTIADMRAVGEGVYTKFSAELLRDLYHRSLQAFDNEVLLSETNQRLSKERILEKSSCFMGLEKRLQKEIKAIPSNLLFVKYRPEEIVRLGRWVASTAIWDASFENDPRFVMEILAKKPINLGWLLGKLSFLDITDMDIIKLFDGAKYFRVAFEGPLEEGDYQFVRHIVEEAFDMGLRLSYARPVIERRGISVDCDHSPSYAKMVLNAKNQKGLMAWVIEVFDELGIDIATAKISTIKNQARDLFLIEKKSGFCEKKREVFARLTKPTR